MRRLRVLVSATVSLAALGLASAAVAGPDACVISGTTATCSGDQSNGIRSGVDFAAPPVTTLTVESLGGDIAPPVGIAGIAIISPPGDVTVNAAPGRSIFVQSGGGFDAPGIIVNTSGTGNIVINNGMGIFGAAPGSAFVGIAGTTVGTAGSVSIVNTGTIGAAGDRMQTYGIDAWGVDGTTVVLNGGDIHARQSAVYAASTGPGGITITGSGAGVLDGADDYGVLALISSTANASDIKIDLNARSIVGLIGGISAQTDGTGDIVVTPQNPDLAIVVTGTDPADHGIFAGRKPTASGGAGNIVVTTLAGQSIVTAAGSGIYAVDDSALPGSGSVTVTNAAIVTAGGAGIVANTTANGGITVDNSGAITGTHGIWTRSSGLGAIHVTGAGTAAIEATDGYGVRALIDNPASAGAITIDLNAAAITAAASPTNVYAVGISAETAGSGDITIAPGNPLLTIAASGGFAGVGIYGIEARSGGTAGAGSIAIATLAGQTISASGVGILADSLGNDTITVDNAATLAGVAEGIRVNGRSAGGVTVTNTGAITANANTTSFSEAIAVGNGSGAASVTNSADVGTAAARFGYGVRAAATALGDARIELNGGSIYSMRGSVSADSATGGVTVTGSGVSIIDATMGWGIYAGASGGTQDVVVDLGVAVINAEQIGIDASSLGTGNVIVAPSDATMRITSQTWDGVLAQAVSGNVTVTTLSGQSITSLGGNGIYASAWGAGSAGTVTVTNAADITAATNGIRAEAGSGDIAVTVTGGTVAGDTAAVAFIGGGANTLVNAGILTTTGGVAVSGGSGGETITNTGTIIGGIDLGGGANAVFNQAGATFATAATLNLGAGSTFTNAGTLSPGGAGTLRTTALTGNLVQTGSGRLVIDVDPVAGTADRIDISGTATLAGVIVVNQIGATGPVPGTQQLTILHADGGVTDDGVSLENTGVVTYQLVFPTSDDVALLHASTDFAPAGLNRDQTALAQHVNAIQLAGGSAGFGPVALALAALLDVPALGRAYDALSPDLYPKTEIAALFSSLGFADTLMGCRVRDGGHAFVRDELCLWAEASGRRLDGDRTAESTGFGDTAWRFAAGGRFAVADGLHLNVATAYEKGSVGTPAASADADRAMAGVGISHQAGPLTLSAAVSGGVGWHDDTRNLAFPGFAGIATADHSVGFIAGRLRAAWQHDMDGWYVKPSADLDVTHLHRDGLGEAGGNGAALMVGGNGTTVVSLSPKVEIGGAFRFDETTVRPFASAGLTLFSETDFAVTSRFRAAPSGVGSFSTVAAIDSVVFDLSAGLTMVGNSGMTLKLSYDGRLGETVSEHSFGARATLPF